MKTQTCKIYIDHIKGLCMPKTLVVSTTSLYLRNMNPRSFSSLRMVKKNAKVRVPVAR